MLVDMRAARQRLVDMRAARQRLADMRAVRVLYSCLDICVQGHFCTCTILRLHRKRVHNSFTFP